MIQCHCQSDLFFFTYRFFGSCLEYGNTLFLISFDNPLVLNISNTYSRYLYGFILFIFANSIKLKYMVLALAPFFVFENKKFFLAITNGLILCSARLLLNSQRPSLKKFHEGWYYVKKKDS